VTHRTTVKDMLTIMPAMLGLHVALGLRYPIVYGGDTIIRLVNFRGILISYQLPLLQLLLHYAMRYPHSPPRVCMRSRWRSRRTGGRPGLRRSSLPHIPSSSSILASLIRNLYSWRAVCGVSVTCRTRALSAAICSPAWHSGPRASRAMKAGSPLRLQVFIAFGASGKREGCAGGI